MKPVNQTKLWVLRIAFLHQTTDLECFADSCSTSWNMPTICRSSLAPAVLREFLLFVPLCQQCHYYQNDEVLTYKGIVSVNDFWLLATRVRGGGEERRSADSIPFPVKFMFCTETLESSDLLFFVQRLRIGDRSRFTTFTENLVIRCYQIAKTFSSRYSEVRQCVFCKEPS